MTGPAYGIRLTVDATGSKQGADLHVRSIEEIKKANAQVTPTVDALAQALRRMGLAEDLVQKSVQRNAAALTAATPTVTALAAAQNQLNASTAGAVVQQQRLTPALAGATTGSHKLTNALQTLAFSATGLPGPLGRVSGILGSLAVGGPLTIAVTAGIAAIAFAWTELTSESRKAKEETRELIDELVKAADLRSGATARKSRAELEADLRQRSATESQFAAFGARGPAASQRERDLEAGAEKARQANLAERARTIKALGELYQQDAEKYVESVDKQNAKDRARAAEQKRLRAEERKAVEELLKSLQEGPGGRPQVADFLTRRQFAEQLAKAEAEAAVKAADARAGKLILLPGGIIMSQGQYDRLRTEGRARLEADAAAGEKAIRAERNQERDRLVEEAAKAAEQRFEAALRTVTDAFQRGFVDLLRGNGVTGFFDGIVGLAQQAAASIAAAFTVRALGLDSLLKKLTAGPTGGGAATGLGAISGPLALGAGIVGGFVSTLLGQAAKEREEARAAAEAQKAYNLGLADFVAIAQPRGVLGDALASLTKQFEDLATQAAAATGIKVGPGASGSNSALGYTQDELLKRLREYDAEAAKYGPRWAEMTSGTRRYFESLLDIRKAYDANIEATKRRIALERQQLSEDLTVRALRAQGFTAEAEAAAFANAQTREMSTEGEKAANAAILAQLGYTQGLEREAYLKAQAVEVQRKLNEQIGIGLSLDEQLFGAKGDPAGAARARRDAGIFDTGLKLQSGALSPENAQKTFDLIWLTFNNTMRDIADAAEAATLALFNYNKTLREDLDVRLLIAQGRDEEANARRFELAQRREYAQAVKDGADAVTLAYLTQVQAAEAVAFATAKAAAEAQKLSDALAAEARATENLTVRRLRATGQAAAADQVALFFQQQEETRRARAEGRSQAYLTQLDAVQTQERAKADADRRAAQQQAFDQAFPTTTAGVIAQSATTVNLAVGLSETTGGRIAGLLASQLAYQASLPRIERLLEVIAARSGMQGALDPDELDRILSGQASGAAGAAGQLPSNR